MLNFKTTTIGKKQIKIIWAFLNCVKKIKILAYVEAEMGSFKELVFLHKLVNTAPFTNFSEYKNDAKVLLMATYWRTGTLKPVMKTELL